MPEDMKKGMHLSSYEREKIMNSLKQGLNFREIGLLLDRDASTISKEVRKHRFKKEVEKLRFSMENRCDLEKTCHRKNVCNRPKKRKCKIVCRVCLKCNELCPDFVPISCKVATKPPYVCNGCPKQAKCRIDKYYYGCNVAEREYKTTLSSSRSGIDMDRDELASLDNLVSPLILKGQPISHIYAEHRDEIKVSERTMYKYIDSGYMAVKNLDLHRVVRYRKRKKIKEPVPSSKLKEGRHYEDFRKYMKEHPDTNVVEMDTVEGTKGGKLLLTMLFRKSNLMLAFLIPDKTKKSIISWFDWMEMKLGTELFTKIFPLILTDNGVEFADPALLETGMDGTKRTSLYYCDPGKSCQKASIEKNHEYIRYILPKGTPFDELTDDAVLLIINHINSTARPGLNERTPMAMAELLFDDKVKEKLGLKLIRPDEVCLKPKLLKR